MCRDQGAPRRSGFPDFSFLGGSAVCSEVMVCVCVWRLGTDATTARLRETPRGRPAEPEGSEPVALIEHLGSSHEREYRDSELSQILARPPRTLGILGMHLH